MVNVVIVVLDTVRKDYFDRPVTRIQDLSYLIDQTERQLEELGYRVGR